MKNQMSKNEDERDIDQHYVDLINGKIKPENQHEVKFLKEVREIEDRGLMVEIPMD
jgi:hypothetical protein